MIGGRVIPLGLGIVSIVGAAACVWVMKGLPPKAWERFAIWLAIGLILYFVYGYKNSTLRRARTASPPPLE
jgi:APA family basic amino acid/polyamine antiporter